MSARRDDLLAQLFGRTGPSDADLQRAWDRLSPIDQDRLRWTATDPTAASHLQDELARALVDGLAADRVARRRLDVMTPVVTALLVLSTVWGFGRAAVPDAAGWFLFLAVVGAVATTVVGWRRRTVARANARAVRRALRR